MAQQRQDRRGEVQAATASATGLACFIFRFLRRPLPVLAYSKMYLYAGAEKYVSPGHSYIDFEQLGLHIGMAVVLIRATTAIHDTMPIYRPMLSAASVLITE